MSALTRRKLLATATVAAAASHVGVVAAASSVDPIFAAIDAHTRAWADFNAAIRSTSAIEDKLLTAGHKYLLPDPELEALGWHEAEAWRGKAEAADIEAWRTLLNTRPMTLAGLLALVRYAGSHEYAAWAVFSEHADDEEDDGPIALPVLRAIERALDGLTA